LTSFGQKEGERLSNCIRTIISLFPSMYNTLFRTNTVLSLIPNKCSPILRRVVSYSRAFNSVDFTFSFCEKMGAYICGTYRYNNTIGRNCIYMLVLLSGYDLVLYLVSYSEIFQPDS